MRVCACSGETSLAVGQQRVRLFLFFPFSRFIDASSGSSPIPPSLDYHPHQGGPNSDFPGHSFSDQAGRLLGIAAAVAVAAVAVAAAAVAVAAAAVAV